MKTGRFHDERHLEWLRQRTEGLSTYHIAHIWGVSENAVVVATNKARRDDLAMSDEPEDEVKKAYWT